MDVTPEEGSRMLREAESIRTNKDYYYNLYNNNCGQFVQTVFNAADKSFAPSPDCVEKEDDITFQELMEDFSKGELSKVPERIKHYIDDKTNDLIMRFKYTSPNGAFEEGEKLKDDNGWDYYEK